MNRTVLDNAGVILVSALVLSGCSGNNVDQRPLKSVTGTHPLRNNISILPTTKKPDQKKTYANCMAEIESLKVGMTQKEVLKILEQDAGVSTRAHRTYYHPVCRREHKVLKVSIVFKEVADAPDKLYNYPKDVVVKISQPFWELRVMD